MKKYSIRIYSNINLSIITPIFEIEQFPGKVDDID